MMRSLAKQIFSSCIQFEGRLLLEWSEFFTCSKKLGESITPPKAGTSPHSSAREQECGATWVSALHLRYNWAQCTEFTLCISAG